MVDALRGFTVTFDGKQFTILDSSQLTENELFRRLFPNAPPKTGYTNAYNLVHLHITYPGWKPEVISKRDPSADWQIKFIPTEPNMVASIPKPIPNGFANSRGRCGDICCEQMIDRLDGYDITYDSSSLTFTVHNSRSLTHGEMIKALFDQNLYDGIQLRRELATVDRGKLIQHAHNLYEASQPKLLERTDPSCDWQIQIVPVN